MHLSPKDKSFVRHILRQLLKESRGALATSMLHPGNGQPDASPGDGLASFLMTVAGYWGIDLDPNQPLRKQREEVNHAPKLKRRDKHVQAGKYFGNDVSAAKQGSGQGLSQLRVLPTPKRLRDGGVHPGGGTGETPVRGKV